MVRARDPSCTQLLHSCLRMESARLRAEAVVALMRLRTGKIALIDHLAHDPSGHVRLMCISALGMPRYRTRAEVFVRALADTDVLVAGAACVHLGHGGHVHAVSAVREVLHHESPLVRYCACDALIALGVRDADVAEALRGLLGEELPVPVGGRTARDLLTLLEETRVPGCQRCT